MKSLTDRDEYVRAWAVQLLCEDMAPSAAALDQFAVMAASDGLPYGAFLGLLTAGLVLSVTLAPFAAAAALKISLS
ncbi:MAG: hypothetical protein IIC63_04965 [Proteobacteria bacterium]|nr:hypothetical protein [Pseudomonadota bacterium]